MTRPPATWWDAMLRRPWIRALVVAAGAAFVLFLVAATLDRLPTAPTESGGAAFVALAAFVLYGLLWRGPVATAGLTWLGVEAGLLLVGLATGPGEVGWGAFFVYATGAGFAAAFGAFVGSWIRSGTGRTVRPEDLDTR